LSITTANAQENQNKDTVSTTNTTKISDNTKSSFYLHPAAILLGLAMDPLLIPFYATLEIPNSLSSSLIIQPSLLLFTDDYGDVSIISPGGNDFNTTFRLGTYVGVRFFPNKKSEGFYLQGLGGIFIHFGKSYEYGYYNEIEKRDYAFQFDIMGYLGYSLKYSGVRIFFDAGIGPGFIKDARGLRFDINMGIGFPF